MKKLNLILLSLLIPTMIYASNVNPVNNLSTGGSGGSVTLPTTTKGDIIVRDSSTDIRLGVGSNDQVLVADSAEASGVKWGTVSGTGDFVGPASSTDNAIVRMSGTTGKLGQNSSVIVDDSNNVTGVVNLTNTGKILTSDGTALLPSYSFSGDPNTGMYSASGDEIHLSLGGVQTVQHTPTAFSVMLPNVGTTSTFSLSNLDNTNAASHVKQFMESGGSSGGDSYYSCGVNSATTYAFGVDNSANDDFIFARASNLDSSKVFTVDNTDLSVEFTGQIYSTQDTETQGASTTHTIDWVNGNSTVWDLQAATGTVTLTLSNPEPGASYIIKIIQSSTARLVTWPAAVLWPSGTAPTLTTTDNGIDVISLYYDGTSYLGNFGLDYQ